MRRPFPHRHHLKGCARGAIFSQSLSHPPSRELYAHVLPAAEYLLTLTDACECKAALAVHDGSIGKGPACNNVKHHNLKPAHRVPISVIGGSV